MLSVYTRHHPECAKKDDSTYRRCRCPKWLAGTLFDLCLDGCGLIWQSLGHYPDSVDEPHLVQAQLGREFLPMPRADISEPVLPADLHCEFDPTDVNDGIREDTCQVIERQGVRSHSGRGAENSFWHERPAISPYCVVHAKAHKPT